jgi:plastocyanin
MKILNASKVTDSPLFSKSDFVFILLVIFATSSGFFWIPSNETAVHPAPTPASIKGKVHFTGSTPKLEHAKTTAFGICGQTHSYDRLVIGKGGGVEYSLVYIANPPAGHANLPAVTIQQKECGYTPHVSIAARGSSVTFVNEDPGLHNVHGYFVSGADRSTLFNFAQPTQGEKSAQQLRKAGMVNLECDVHPWMSAWIWVTDNPYAAVTNADGSYSIDGLPPGTYTVVMWHEGWKMNTSDGGRPTFSGNIVEQQQITISDGESKTLDFELK